jgi:alpha-L-fucosidase
MQASIARQAWLREARWGVMTHYLYDWIARDRGIPMSPERWAELIAGFDARGLAEQLESVGAGYLILTLGQNSGYYLAPNATYAGLVPERAGHLAPRDLVSDLSSELRARGIRLIVYLPSGAPNRDEAREALEWRNGPHRNRAFGGKWEAVVRDWSLRFGHGVDGWWFDGCYWPNHMYRSEPPNFETLAAAARAGNPASAVAFNPGVVPRLLSVTPFEDYVAGEISDPSLLQIRRVEEGRIDGKQVHVLSYLGRSWGTGEPRYATEEVLEWSREVASAGGVVTWDVPVTPRGLLSEAFLGQLRAVGDALGGEPDPATPGHD